MKTLPYPRVFTPSSPYSRLPVGTIIRDMRDGSYAVITDNDTPRHTLRVIEKETIAEGVLIHACVWKAWGSRLEVVSISPHRKKETDHV